MALGAVLVLAALIGGFVLLLGGDDDSDDGGSGIERGPLDESFRDDRLGLSLLYPSEWERAESGGVVRFTSPDECVRISLSAPAAAAQADDLRKTAIAALRREYGRISLRQLPPATADGETTTGALVALATRGDPAVIRLTVTKTKRYSHLTSVLLRRPPCEDARAETEAILASILYTR